MGEPKAFTGRGGAAGGQAAEERRLRRAVERIEEELLQLAESTKGPAGRSLHLAVHRRPSGGIFVRWRRNGVQAGHVSWERFADEIDGQPEALRQWYCRVNQEALRLNDEARLRMLALSLYLCRRKRLAALTGADRGEQTA
ncbi:MAG: hypothetical protein KDG52_21510 [Rhodocyclaceae bacterium]|nr:hypothetical protein [Rhodocyclaceae bacterium]